MFSSESSAPNWKLIEKLFSTTALLYLILSFFLIVIIGLVGYFSLQIPIDNLTNKKIGWLSFITVLIAIFINFNGSKYRLFLQGINKVALIQRNQAIISTVTILLSSLTVLLTKSLFYLILIQQLGAIVMVIVLRSFSKQFFVLKKSRFNLKTLDRKLIKSIFPIAWRSWVGVLMSYGLVQASGIIIAQTGNSAITSSYLFSIKVFEIVKNFANAPFYSKIPFMNQLFIKNSKAQLYNLATQRMNFTMLTQTVAFGIIIIFGDYLLKFIGSNVGLVDNNILIILMLSYTLERYGALHIQLLSLSNNIIWHIANGVTGGLFIVFSYLFLHKLNDPILAFSLSLLLSYLCFYSWYAPYKSYKFYEMNFLKTEYRVTLKSIILVILIMVVSFLTTLK
ncbi:hypothetical protein JCM19301_3761 [Jejuia pallidilutea]|uniref:O-antigen flippase Wzx n=1 Tax=Jejuia pallidilutea TaxID=504487 RepID=A0A090VKM9_9FLAO|nr:hypothetical protein JCM19301_3761 [Jejuia pallidilutea]